MTRSPSRWPAGTLAAAGTTPARTIEASPTLVISQGHHPPKHRSAIPTRAYESGSGHGHDAAPAGHPHPPRPPPPAVAIPSRPCPRRHHRRPPAPPQGRLRRRCASSASAPRPLTRPSRAHKSGAHQAWAHPCLPRTAQQTSPKTTQTTETPAHHLQKLDEPFHMSAQLHSSPTTNPQIGALSLQRVHDREPLVRL